MDTAPSTPEASGVKPEIAAAASAAGAAAAAKPQDWTSALAALRGRQRYRVNRPEMPSGQPDGLKFTLADLMRGATAPVQQEVQEGQMKREVMGEVRVVEDAGLWVFANYEEARRKQHFIDVRLSQQRLEQETERAELMKGERERQEKLARFEAERLEKVLEVERIRVGRLQAQEAIRVAEQDRRAVTSTVEKLVQDVEKLDKKRLEREVKREAKAEAKATAKLEETKETVKKPAKSGTGNKASPKLSPKQSPKGGPQATPKVVPGSKRKREGQSPQTAARGGQTPSPQAIEKDSQGSGQKKKKQKKATEAEGETDELFCICKQPYDESALYIGTSTSLTPL
jgi:hypothetical protein